MVLILLRDLLIKEGNLPNPWNRVLEKLAFIQLVKKLPIFYGT
jgi:hypothetical protein